MDSTNNGSQKDKLEEAKGNQHSGQTPFNISTSRRTLLTNDTSESNSQAGSSPVQNRFNFLKFGSVSAKFKRLAQERDKISHSMTGSSSSSSSSGHRFRERVNGVFGHKIDWPSLSKMGKEWIRDPMNMALFVWILCVAISGAILFLVMTGMLNATIPKKSQRDVWFEVNNQILNALFTLMCLYQHPKRFYHLILLIRWEPKDIARLRKIYCKNGTYKPHEWAHMIVVVILLQINCFAQYALCGLNLGYKRSQRPAIGVGITISLAIGAPAIAGLYAILSPLGKDYDSETDEEAQIEITTGDNKRPEQLRSKTLEKRYSFAVREEQNVIETRPLWSGGILDIWDDISVAYLSLFCTFCVFGWNMERLGFGNMYVHIATFLLFCMAPFWIFNLAAVNIDNETVREALGLTGIILCAFGLLYGGFWRIQMRKRFNLPAYTTCFGKPEVSECMLWLCCCWCSLAQEVRTGNSYNIVEHKFCAKHVGVDNHQQNSASPLQNGSGPSSPSDNKRSPLKFSSAISPSTSKALKGYDSPDSKPFVLQEERSEGCTDKVMVPPSPVVIERETL